MRKKRAKSGASVSSTGRRLTIYIVDCPPSRFRAIHNGIHKRLHRHTRYTDLTTVITSVLYGSRFESSSSVIPSVFSPRNGSRAAAGAAVSAGTVDAGLGAKTAETKRRSVDKGADIGYVLLISTNSCCPKNCGSTRWSRNWRSINCREGCINNCESLLWVLGEGYYSAACNKVIRFKRMFRIERTHRVYCSAYKIRDRGNTHSIPGASTMFGIVTSIPKLSVWFVPN